MLIIFLFSCHFIKVHGQLFSDHYQEVVRQQSLQNYPIPKWDSLRCAWYGECPVPYAGTKILNANACPLNKIMFGWHAGGTSPSSYVWQSLSDLSFFSYQVNPATGAPLNPTLIAGWGNDAAVVTAKNNGVRVNLCVTLFQSTNQFSTFFGSPSAQSTLITNLINEVVTVGANGINIDFEGPGLSTTYLTQFSSFMSTLSTQLHAAVPNSVLSFDLQGSTSSSSALLTALNPSVDLMIMMGYDYYWAGQFYPGPIAPTYQFTKATSDLNGHGNVSNDLNNVLKYIPASKVVLAMPYYGRRWKVTNGCTLPGIGTQETISTVTYTLFRQNANGYYSNTLREPEAFTAYHCFTDINAIENQQFIDDSISMQYKYNLIRQRGIAGGAVWRLGYDAGYADLWNKVNSNLSNCAETLCTDTLYDMGGPLGNYQNTQNYTFTIAPPGADDISLQFYSFDLENNSDSLRVYNGSSTSAPLIGSFTGNSLPAPLVANSGVITIQFHADGGTNRPGFKALYTCSPVPLAVRSANSGDWENPATWVSGSVPLSSDSVVVMPGHTVSISDTVKARNLYVFNSGAITLNNNSALLTIGNPTNKTNRVIVDGSLQVINGKMVINGNLELLSASYFVLSDTLVIDGNTGIANTSVANGFHLFNVLTVVESGFLFGGGTVQIINPPFGSSSQAINCPFNFGAASTLLLGNGVSTIASNNPDGFGGNLLPAEIGLLVLDAVTPANNRIFRNVNPLHIKTKCEVKSGNLVQGALLSVTD